MYAGIAFVCYIIIQRVGNDEGNGRRKGGREGESCLLYLLLPVPPEYSTVFPHTGHEALRLCARARVYRVYKQRRRQPPGHFSAGRMRLNVGHKGVDPPLPTPSLLSPPTGKKEASR